MKWAAVCERAAAGVSGEGVSYLISSGNDFAMV